VEICSLVEKLFLGVIFRSKIPGYSPSVKFGTFLIIPHFFASRPASMGMLIVKIGRTVKKLLKGDFFMKTPRLLPRMEFWCLYFVPLVEMNQLVLYLWKPDQLKGCSMGMFWKFPGCSPKMKVEKLLMFPYVSSSWAKFIGELRRRIERTGDKLFNSVFWLEIPIGGVFQKTWPLERNFGDLIEIC
jgi:hypothetical protein